jgi:hypothetical protein
MGLFEEFQISLKIFHSFLNEVSIKYIAANPYHNYHHGCDVFHTTYRLMATTYLINILSKLEILAILVAAICHDIGHIGNLRSVVYPCTVNGLRWIMVVGVNNIFLVKAKHELAIQHNDRSPLENMHCMILYHDILGKKVSSLTIVNICWSCRLMFPLPLGIQYLQSADRFAMA